MGKDSCDIRTLRGAGYKLTAPREMVLDFLRNGEHYTTKEIYEGLNKTLGLTTVYRTLELLLEVKLVKPLFLTDGSLRYEYIGNKYHHHHLICSDCGKICELEGCAIVELEEKVRQNTSYEITSHALELYGVCPDCQRVNKDT
ncbi:MAG: Fur family transcriptional regulator [Bacillota bacterium]